ncbi:MAG: sigma-70 family RNA polymerase sigma factor [Clostridia bacterium]|nr:sigma-70 family RNA polymerase sigma factor [Clostridia bacterium]
MRRFTVEEFNIMVDELLLDEPKFDMLCVIARKQLEPMLEKMCTRFFGSSSTGHADDLVQEISLHLMVVTVPHFLLKDVPTGAINNDPDGFCAWMTTVAKRKCVDFARKENKRLGMAVDIDDLLQYLSVEDSYGMFDEDDGIPTLRAALKEVLSWDVAIYKTLTWMAYFVFMLAFDVSAKGSGDIILKNFEDRTLREMFAMIILVAKSRTWLELSAKQHARIVRALSEPWTDGRPYGEVRYGDLFMSKGGRSSISDWINKLNTKLRKMELSDDTFND